jgi:hypothetical protein
LSGWRGRIVEVVLRGKGHDEGDIHLAVLEDFDERGAYLATDVIVDIGFETLIDDGFYFWENISVIRPWKPSKEEIEYIPSKFRKYLVEKSTGKIKKW